MRKILTIISLILFMWSCDLPEIDRENITPNVATNLSVEEYGDFKYFSTYYVVQEGDEYMVIVYEK